MWCHYRVQTKANRTPYQRVIGEHYNSQFVARSNVSIASQAITEILDKETIESIEESTRMKAFETIKTKGYTSYGIANSTSIVVEAILKNAKTTLAVSSYSSVDDYYVGHPAVVGREGVIRDFHLKLNEKEQAKWEKSVKTIKDTAPIK